MPRTGLTTEQLKERAVELTVQRMRQLGFEKVRLIDIAKDLGVSHAALYSHFADKAALLDAVSERWLDELDAQLENIRQSAGTDPIKAIEEWFLALHRARFQKVSNDPELFRAFNYSAQAFKPFVKRHLATIFEQLLGLVQQAIDSGRIDGEPVRVTRLLFMVTITFHHPAMVVENVEAGPGDESLLEVLNLAFHGFGLAY